MTPNVRAKKSLGQNFLVNPGVLDRIMEAAALTAADTVLEIGPGTGALTHRLADSGARVIAVEKDRRLIEPLLEEFADAKNVQVIEGDALELDPASMGLAPRAYKLVANIPYYLSSHLLRLALEIWPAPKLSVLMVQREVADRMMAQPPDMNLLALSVQLYARPSLVMRVSRGSFRPMPSVDSAVIMLEPKPNAQREDNERIIALAKRAFIHKRKQLGSSFLEEALKNAGIDPSARPQELSVAQWEALAVNLQ